eukprot:1159652-Pelagomonas_calceolata.AAC.4
MLISSPGVRSFPRLLPLTYLLLPEYAHFLSWRSLVPSLVAFDMSATAGVRSFPLLEYAHFFSWRTLISSLVGSDVFVTDGQQNIPAQHPPTSLRCQSPFTCWCSFCLPAQLWGLFGAPAGMGSARGCGHVEPGGLPGELQAGAWLPTA